MTAHAHEKRWRALAASTQWSAIFGLLLHKLIKAYRGLRIDDFERFLGFFKEAGLDLVATGWNAFFAPAAMPAAQVQRLSTAIREELASVKDLLDLIERGTAQPDSFGNLHALLGKLSKTLNMVGLSSAANALQVQLPAPHNATAVPRWLLPQAPQRVWPPGAR